MSNLNTNMWHLDINHPSQAMWDLTYMVATYLPTCRNPTLAKCGGEAQHLEKLEVGSLPRLPNV